jgi:hypothetical protein
VDADELAVLIPSLCTPRARVPLAGPIGEGIPAAVLRRALAARLYECTLEMAAPGLENPLDVIVRSGVVTTLPPGEASRECAPAWRELFGSQSTAEHALRLKSAESPQARDERWLFELSVLASLDRLLADAGADRRDAAAPEAPISLSDALVGSVYASFNAAYLYPHLAAMHELLMVGAWLGHLVRRRDALMPLFIAEPMLDHLERARLSDGSDAAECEELIELHAEIAGGRDWLLDHAKRVSSTGRVRLIDASRADTSNAKRLVVWNEGLAREIRPRLGPAA